MVMSITVQGMPLSTLLLTCLRTLGCSDLHLSAGAPPFVRRMLQIERIDSYVLTPEDAARLLRAKTIEAIEKLKAGKMKPYCNPETVSIRTEFIERQEPHFGLVADRTTERTGSSIERVFLNF